MSDNVLSVLTFKSVETILEAGGSQSWAMDRNRAKACKYVVVCRNAHHASTEGKEAHGSAFMVGRVKDVVPSSETKGRWNVLFSEYAIINVGDQWEGRNPVTYWTTEDFDQIDFESLDYKPMPKPMQDEDENEVEPIGLTIAEAKAGLSRTFGVDPSAIEITIRG